MRAVLTKRVERFMLTMRRSSRASLSNPFRWNDHCAHLSNGHQHAVTIPSHGGLGLTARPRSTTQPTRSDPEKGA